MSDVLHQLLGLDFGSAVRRSLLHLEHSYGGNQLTGIPGIGEEVNEQIVNEIIFQQPRCQAGFNKTLNYLQEIQLLDIFIRYFKGQQNEWATNAIFSALFGCNPLPPYRLELLQKFVSMALGVGCSNALNSAALWMQMQGCGSEFVTKITQAIADDYCMLGAGDEEEQSSVLASLPDLSSHFTCNFITSITHIYQPTAHQNKPGVPNALLRLMTAWLSERPQLCLFSLYSVPSTAGSQHCQANMWTSPTKPNTQTPIPGLVHWCTNAPLLLHYTATNSKNSSSRKCNSSNKENMDNADDGDMSMVWSKLHLALLECIAGFSNVPGASRLELLTLGDMSRIIKGVCTLIKNMPPNAGAECLGTLMPVTEVKETAVDRMVQILQVSLSTGAFRCSLADLKSIFSTIPESRLLHALSQQHLSVTPPQMHNERL